MSEEEPQPSTSKDPEPKDPAPESGEESVADDVAPEPQPDRTEEEAAADAPSDESEKPTVLSAEKGLTELRELVENRKTKISSRRSPIVPSRIDEDTDSMALNRISDDPSQPPIRIGRARDSERELRRTQSLMGASRREKSSDKEAQQYDKELADLVLLVAHALPKERQEKVLKRIESDKNVARRFKKVTRHFDTHQSVKSTSVPAGSFQRLSERMHRRGYLQYAYPGSHCLWRRAAILASSLLIAFLIIGYFRNTSEGLTDRQDASGPFATMTLLDESGEPLGPAGQLNYTIYNSSGEGGARLWLGSGQRRVASRVQFGRDAEFRLINQNQLQIRTGHAFEIFVHPDSASLGEFQISSDHLFISTRSARLSVLVKNNETSVNVFHGYAEVRRTGSPNSVVVHKGEGVKTVEGDRPLVPYPLIELRASQLNDQASLRVNMYNRSDHTISIDRAGGPKSFPFRANLSSDAQARGWERIHSSFALIPAVAMNKATASISPHFGHQRLLPGSENEAPYFFQSNLSLRLAGVPASVYSVEVQYLGELESELLGPLEFRPSGTTLRLDLRNGNR